MAENNPAVSSLDDYQWVAKPKHYEDIHGWGFTCVDMNEYMTGNMAAAVKHLWRVGNKPGMTKKMDLEKAMWYINRELGSWQVSNAGNMLPPDWFTKVQLPSHLIGSFDRITYKNPIYFICAYVFGLPDYDNLYARFKYLTMALTMVEIELRTPDTV